jgi:hypothetical protein
MLLTAFAAFTMSSLFSAPIRSSDTRKRVYSHTLTTSSCLMCTLHLPTFPVQRRVSSVFWNLSRYADALLMAYIGV